MSEINVISENINSTVVSEYKGIERNNKYYQSEAELEKELIKTLQSQGYEYLTFSSETELINNLRDKLERLNNKKFSDNDWTRFFIEHIANKNNGILEKNKYDPKRFSNTF